MRRRCLPWVIALAAALLLAPTAGAVTTTIDYRPFAADGTLAPGLRATAAFGGTCDTGSFVVAGDDVFRCFAADVIRDPCFRDDAGSSSERAVVVCVAAPWATDVVRLRVRGALDPSGGAPAGGPPWALQLASGRRCVQLEGATTVVAGRRQSYGCDGHRWLFGSPDRTAATWRIRQATTPGGAHMRKVEIATAWR